MSKKIENIYIEKEDYYILRIASSKYGVCDFKIDKDDYERCSKLHWSVNRFNRKSVELYLYAVNTEVGLLHRYIKNCPKGMVVDHVSGDTFDNRKSSLQICRHRENLMKQKHNNTNTSGHKGVVHMGKFNIPKWMAYIGVYGKQVNLGYFDELDDAISARKNAELKYFGDFAPME